MKNSLKILQDSSEKVFVPRVVIDEYFIINPSKHLAYSAIICRMLSHAVEGETSIFLAAIVRKNVPAVGSNWGREGCGFESRWVHFLPLSCSILT